MFWSSPFASSTTTSMISAVVVPCSASARITANAPETNAPMKGTYAVTNVTTAIVPARGTSSKTAAIADDDAVERGHDRDAQEVAAQRPDHVPGDGGGDRERYPEMPVDPAADHRPVFQHEERRKQGEGQEEDHRGEALDPARRPVEELGATVGNSLGNILLGARGPVRAGVVRPSLDLVERLCGGSLDLGGVLDDPAEHEQRHDDCECDQEQQDDESTREPRQTFRLHRTHERACHGGDNRARNHRSDDRRDLTEQPDGAEQHSADTEEEPRLEPEVAKPGRRAEHSGELAFVELVRGAFGRRFRRLRFRPMASGIFIWGAGAVRPGKRD